MNNRDETSVVRIDEQKNNYNNLRYNRLNSEYTREYLADDENKEKRLDEAENSRSMPAHNQVVMDMSKVMRHQAESLMDMIRCLADRDKEIAANRRLIGQLDSDLENSKTETEKLQTHFKKENGDLSSSLKNESEKLALALKDAEKLSETVAHLKDKVSSLKARLRSFEHPKGIIGMACSAILKGKNSSYSN